MKIYMNGLLYAISYALDCVERELAGVSSGHSKRVAYISSLMGTHLGLRNSQLTELAACAVMHDSALTEFFTKELAGNFKTIEEINLSSHCILGERNMEGLPFSPDTRNAVLYHHENADGSGPFGKTASETPVFARLIHFSDILDVNCNFGEETANKYRLACEFVDRNCGTVFDQELCNLFKTALNEQVINDLQEKKLNVALEEIVPTEYTEYNKEEIIKMMYVFARIIDYKSNFTKNHSLGVAQKALKMGKRYGYDDEVCSKIYIAGILHDIGKVAIDNKILEKPGRLTEEEFEIMKSHALYTYNILSEIKGFDEIASWAALHHEKLDGSGYPFGKKADELNHMERLMACIDIYQALSENRPYKRGFTHEECMKTLKNMAGSGFIDGKIVEEIQGIF